MFYREMDSDTIRVPAFPDAGYVSHDTMTFGEYMLTDF